MCNRTMKQKMVYRLPITTTHTTPINHRFFSPRENDQDPSHPYYIVIKDQHGKNLS